MGKLKFANIQQISLFFPPVISSLSRFLPILLQIILTSSVLLEKFHFSKEFVHFFFSSLFNHRISWKVGEKDLMVFSKKLWRFLHRQLRSLALTNTGEFSHLSVTFAYMYIGFHNKEFEITSLSISDWRWVYLKRKV